MVQAGLVVLAVQEEVLLVVLMVREEVLVVREAREVPARNSLGSVHCPGLASCPPQ